MKEKKDSIANTSIEAKGKAESCEIYPYFNNLPEPLTTHILLQLPINSLLICRCVCTNWKALISEPRFAKLHFQQAQTCFMIRPDEGNKRLVSRTLYLLESDPEKFEIGSKGHVRLAPIFKLPLRDTNFRKKGDKFLYKPDNPVHHKFHVANSCNGLLCLCHPFNGNPLVICNPVTGEFIRLPEDTTSHSHIPLDVVGFGFQSETNEYKVIKMWMRHADGWPFQQVMLEIHTLGTPSWRNVEVDNKICISRLTHDTYVNSTFHWIRSQRSILCFSLESEKLQLFPSPPHVFEHNNNIFDKCHISMGELKGLLYIFDDSSPHNVTMWVMKNYGIGESWTKVYNIDTFLSNDLSPLFSSYWPVKHFEEGAAILSLHSSNCFIFFEPGKYGFKVFQIHGIQSKYFGVIPHIPSLISLKDVVKGDNVEVLNIHSRCAKYKLREENKALSLVQEFVSDLATYGEEFSEEHAS